MEAVRLHELIDGLQHTIGTMCIVSRNDPTAPNNCTGLAVEELIRQLESLDQLCDALTLYVCRPHIARVLEDLRLQVKHPQLLVEGHQHIPANVNLAIDSIRDEASFRIYFQLPELSKRHFENKRPFGDRVWTVIPAAIRDVEEASKCLAFQRATACVFHCMRATDLAIRALIEPWPGGFEFLAKKERRIWIELIRRIRQEAQKGDHAIAPLWKGKSDRLNSIAEKLNAVADASRNPTMHADIHYSTEEAEDVFNTTRAFMRRLAEELMPQEANDQKATKPEDSEGPRNPDPEAQGRDARPDEGGESPAA